MGQTFIFKKYEEWKIFDAAPSVHTSCLIPTYAELVMKYIGQQGTEVAHDH
jgi:hypothetical protein